MPTLVPLSNLITLADPSTWCYANPVIPKLGAQFPRVNASLDMLWGPRFQISEMCYTYSLCPFKHHRHAAFITIH